MALERGRRQRVALFYGHDPLALTVERDGPKLGDRSAVGKPLLYPNDPHIVAVVSDVAPEDSRLPSANLDDIEAIADLVDGLARPYPP